MRFQAIPLRSVSEMNCDNKPLVETEAYLKHLQTRNVSGPSSTAKYRHQKQDYIDSVKTPCVKCKEPRKYVIDFHHIDPASKLCNINLIIKGHSWDALREELKKCICLCRNCHQEFHYFYSNSATKLDLLEYLNCTDTTLEQYKPKV